MYVIHKIIEAGISAILLAVLFLGVILGALAIFGLWLSDQIGKLGALGIVIVVAAVILIVFLIVNSKHKKKDNK